MSRQTANLRAKSRMRDLAGRAGQVDIPMTAKELAIARAAATANSVAVGRLGAMVGIDDPPSFRIPIGDDDDKHKQ